MAISPQLNFLPVEGQLLSCANVATPSLTRAIGHVVVPWRRSMWLTRRAFWPAAPAPAAKDGHRSSPHLFSKVQLRWKLFPTHRRGLTSDLREDSLRVRPGFLTGVPCPPGGLIVPKSYLATLGQTLKWWDHLRWNERKRSAGFLIILRFLQGMNERATA